MLQLSRLVDAGNIVILVEHGMQAIACSYWVFDIGAPEQEKKAAKSYPLAHQKNSQLCQGAVRTFLGEIY